MTKWEFGKMEWILLGIGILVGGGVGTGLTWKLLKPSAVTQPIVIEDKTSEKQQDVVLQLTDLDLVKEACGSEFIVVQGQGPALCRELFCRMQQRGVDAKTGSSECESISNVSNKIMIHDFCKETAMVDAPSLPAPVSEDGLTPPATAPSGKVVDDTKLKACIEFFDRRI